MIVLFLGKHHRPVRPLPEESCVHVAGVAVALDPFHPPSQDGHRVLIPEGRKTDGSMGKSFALTCKRSDTSSSLLASHLLWDRSCPSPEPQKTAQRSAQCCSVLLLLGLNHVGMGIGLSSHLSAGNGEKTCPSSPEQPTVPLPLLRQARQGEKHEQAGAASSLERPLKHPVSF